MALGFYFPFAGAMAVSSPVLVGVGAGVDLGVSGRDFIVGNDSVSGVIPGEIAWHSVVLPGSCTGGSDGNVPLSVIQTVSLASLGRPSSVANDDLLRSVGPPPIGKNQLSSIAMGVVGVPDGSSFDQQSGFLGPRDAASFTPVEVVPNIGSSRKKLGIRNFK